MVIPWVGIPLADVIKRLEPEPSAKFVEFTTLHDVGRMPGQRLPVLPVAVRRGAADGRSDEPAVDSRCRGCTVRRYRTRTAPRSAWWCPGNTGSRASSRSSESGSPRDQPRNSWEIAAPREYGFYANVNPEVNHPRWSQATERRLGRFFRQDTEMFNGYSAQVAQMYSGMDLRRNF